MTTLDELVEALVLFDLLQNELTGESATPLLWIAPHLARISGEIGTRWSSGWTSDDHRSVVPRQDEACYRQRSRCLPQL
jgi:hypothetical protein